MYCPKCSKEFTDNYNFCSECGEKLEPSIPSHSNFDKSKTCEPSLEPSTSPPPLYSEKGQTFKGDAVITRSDIGDKIGGDKIEGDGVDGDKIIGTKIIYTAPQSVIFHCPRCGHNVKEEDTFDCKECEGTFCSARCYDEEYNCCKVCASELAKKEKFDCDGCGETVKMQKTFVCRQCGQRWCRVHCHDEKYNSCKKCAMATKEREPRINQLCRAQLAFAEGHKIFIIAKDRIGFGRAKRSKEPELDIVMRVLPVRSCELDPENWQKSSRLSGCHGYFAFRKEGMFLKDNNSRNGLFRVPEKMGKSLCDSSMTDIDDTEPEEDKAFLALPKGMNLKPYTKGEWSHLHDSSIISLCKTGVLLLKTQVFRQSGMITAFKIERLTNWPQHVYIQLISKAVIGNSERSAVQLKDPAITGEVAELTWEERDVAFYLTRLSEKTEVRVDSHNLELDEKVMLSEGNHIRIGDTTFEYTTATDDDFVNV